MNFFNSKNKFFLDMSKAEMISHSIVIVDNTKIVVNQAVPVSSNPFAELSSKIVLSTIMGNLLGSKQEPIIDSSSFERSFVFDDIIFKSSSLPPKVIIQQNSTELSNKIQDIFTEILREIPEIESAVAAVGINFELFVAAEDSSAIKTKIFQEDMAKELESMQTTLVYPIKDNDNCKLNLTIADANYKEQKGLYFKANFHNIITADNKLKDILKMPSDLLKQAKAKIEKLLK